MSRVGNLSLNQLIELIKLYGGGSGGGGGGSGDVTGPGSSTGNAVARFDGTGGKTLKNSGVTVDDSNNMTVAGDITVEGSDVVIKNGSNTATISIDSDGNVTITPSVADGRIRLDTNIIEDKGGGVIEKIDGESARVASEVLGG